MTLLLDFNTHTDEELSNNLEVKDFGSGLKILEAAEQFEIHNISEALLTGYWFNPSLAKQIWAQSSASASKQDLEFIKLYSYTEPTTAANFIKIYPFNELHRYPFSEFLESLWTLPQQVRNNLIPLSEIDNQTIQLAEQFIKHLYELITTNGLPWILPHIATDGEGEVSFEWWRNKNVLTLFVNSSGQIEYLKAWGPHIWREMEEGNNPTDQELLNLWQWLFV